MRLICCRNKLTPTDYQHNIIVLTRSILLFGLAILMLISVAAKDTLPSDGVVAPLSLNMGANKSGNIFNRDAPPLPTMVGCFLLVHSSWVAVPCLSPEEAAKLPPLMEGGNYGVKGGAFRITRTNFPVPMVTPMLFSLRSRTVVHRTVGQVEAQTRVCVFGRST